MGPQRLGSARRGRRRAATAIWLWGASALLLAYAGSARADSLTLGVATDSTCQASNSFNQSGVSIKNWTQCGSVLGAFLANDQAFAVDNTGRTSSLAVDAAVAADAGTTHGNRGHMRHQLGFLLTVTIDVDPGDEWMLEFDQQARGLLAVLEEAPGEGSGVANILFDINQSISVGLGGGDYDLHVSPSSLSRDFTDSLEIFDSRTDLITGVGDATLNGFVRAQIGAYSQCLNTAQGACVNGDETAMLFGIDGVAGAAAVTVDDYSSWGRSPGADGYDALFTLTVIPEPATALLLATGLAGLAMRRLH